MPSANSATASAGKLGAKAQAASDTPQPAKNSAIMLRRLQRSASQPAGSENTPNETKAAVDSAIISE